MEVIELERVFVFKYKGEEVRLTDPSDKYSPERVLDYYTRIYPILVNANVVGGVVENDEMVYRFESKIGTKG